MIFEVEGRRVCPGGKTVEDCLGKGLRSLGMVLAVGK